ncbi:hypothetical protein FE36_09960 [Xanthomonas oryzae pv. oryzicola]|nr:hypothetical protein FE36_09960 [Xanthomonas oryzae pv. oryzicola]QEO97415.1 hypothetical protein XOCgx_2425 [Xanthomonas oryzae pv. oryzicola]
MRNTRVGLTGCAAAHRSARSAQRAADGCGLGTDRLAARVSHPDKHCGTSPHISSRRLPVSTRFISRRDLSAFIGHPMPRHYPDYPSHRQILAYLRSFATTFGLREKIQFDTAVLRIDQQADGRWRLTLADGSQRVYAAVICASGVNWDPSMCPTC